MKKLISIVALTTLCSCSVNGSFRLDPKGHGSTAHAYEDSFKAALNTPLIARDLTDEEIDNADTAPGSGYHDGQKVAEEADRYAVERIYQDEDGTIVIIDDDGQVTIVGAAHI